MLLGSGICRLKLKTCHCISEEFAVNRYERLADVNFCVAHVKKVNSSKILFTNFDRFIVVIDVKMSMNAEEDHGHSFEKKTFHKPTYCHHCSDMLWGITNQGNMCKGDFFCYSIFSYEKLFL